MRTLLRAGFAAAAAATVAGALAAARPGEAFGGSDAGLAIRDGGRWITFWRADAAPDRWSGAAPLADHIAWRPGADGIEWGELVLRAAREGWRTRVVIARLDPRRVALSLAPAFTGDQRWTVGDAGGDAALALDAGQFRGSLPWGWVVTDGREILSPQYAPLAGAVVVDSSGGVRVVPPDGVAAERARGGAREAFQSYPMLLRDGVVPAPLTQPGRGVEVAHRDARLALGTMADGRVVIALTRFDALGESLGRIPFGFTSEEMAAVMGALGCRQALLLDGGISGQMMVRDAEGAVRTWAGTRSVPLGLVGRTR
ncbi:MAG: phosphodiester glycosidase family protein [Gemmatimonadales bacterium]